MATGDNLYSRLVAWMKIILPLTALGLLSTLFLLSRKVDPSDSIPFARIDLTQRASDQGATNPTFTGVTLGGDRIRFQAQAVRPDPDDRDQLRAEDVSSRIHLVRGGVVTVTSLQGSLDQRRQIAVLGGDVEIETSSGYKMRTSLLETRFDTLRVESRGAVTGSGPPGELTAGRLLLTSAKGDGAAQLLFTDGVKLIYRPPEPEE